MRCRRNLSLARAIFFGFCAFSIFLTCRKSQAVEKQPLPAPSDVRQAVIQAAESEDAAGQLANWYRGLVHVDGQWLSPVDAEQMASQNSILAEYAERRAEFTDTALDHEKLARWCQKVGLADLSRMHWMHVLRLSPNDKRALAALDLNWVDDYLLNSDEEKLYKQQLEEFVELKKIWKAKLRRLRRDLQHGTPAEQLAAAEDLQQIRDPAAVPVLLEEFAGEKEEPDVTSKLHAQATRALVNIDSPASTESLATLAVSSPWELVRYTAREGLKSRPYNQYVPLLLSELQMPIEASAKVQEIGSNIVTTYSYSQEGPADQRYEREYSSYQRVPANKYIGADIYRSRVVPRRLIKEAHTIPAEHHPAGFYCGGGFRPAHTHPARYVPASYSREYVVTEYDRTVYADNPFYAVTRDRVAANSQANANDRIDGIVKRNEIIEGNNQAIAEVLTDLTGQPLPPEPKSWWKWWGDFLIDNPDQATAGARQQLSMALLNQEKRGLARGNWVWTNLGRKPIEQVLHGDYVLAQNPHTGELAYKAVLAITYPLQLEVDKISLGDDSIHCAGGHVVWVTGKGWQLASKLSTKDSLHGVSDETKVTSRSKAFTIDSYDLVVDDFHTFFVGETGILVHDASPVEPAPAAVPGISPAAFAAAIDLLK